MPCWTRPGGSLCLRYLGPVVEQQRPPSLRVRRPSWVQSLNTCCPFGLLVQVGIIATQPRAAMGARARVRVCVICNTTEREVNFFIEVIEAGDLLHGLARSAKWTSPLRRLGLLPLSALQGLGSQKTLLFYRQLRARPSKMRILGRAPHAHPPSFGYVTAW